MTDDERLMAGSLAARFMAGEESVTQDIQPFMHAMAAEGRLADEAYPARVHTVTLAGTSRPSAARVYGSDAREGIAGTVRFDFDALDWFEEDEPIIGHARNPYVRVDALRSHRHVVIARDGLVVARTTSPVLLFETGLPTRYYIDRTDVDFSHLTSSDTESVCPYKGITSSYWSLRTEALNEPTRRGLGLRPAVPAGRSDRRSHRVLQRETRHHH